ncbi:MAG: outer membrane beta-barrel protein [Deltaproteobacteria bacterium]|nr:outer membrane beta-barrel protein [Deltaproteobacteria bacterium]
MQKIAIIAPALTLLVAMPAVASAQDDTLLLEAPAPTATAEAAAPSFSGFVDSSLIAPIDGFAPGSRGVAFGLGQAEFDARFTPDPELEIGIDLNYFPSSPLGAADGLLEQGFVTWSPDAADGLAITVGKQNAPIGLESLDPVDLATVSGGLIWSYGVPSNLTGLFIKQDMALGSVQLFTTAEWDTPSAVGGALIGGRVDLTQGPLWVGLVATHGPAPEGADPARTMANLTAGYELGSLTLSGEYLYTTVDGDEAKGWTLLATQAINDKTNLTVRVDQLKKEFGDAIDQADVTLVAGYSPTPHLSTMLEVKQAAVGEDGATTSLAFGVTASF